MENCIFCKIIKKEIKSDLIYEDKSFIIINDINPISKGHCLLIPKQHFQTILDLPQEYSSQILNLIKKYSSNLINQGLASGIKLIQNNFPSAGQTINHFHIHIIPQK